MSLLVGLAALGAGYSGWQEGKDEAQRREARKLQMQNTRLRNEGLGYDNTLARETLDTRIFREHEDTRGVTADSNTAEWQERFAKSQTMVQEALQPHQIRGGIAEADQAVEAVNTQRATTQATQALTGKRQAETRRIKGNFKAEEAERIRGDIGATIENLGGLSNTLRSPEGHGALIGYANQIYSQHLRDGQQIGRVIENPDNPGTYMLRDTDGNPITYGRMSREEEDALGADELQRQVAVFGEAEMLDALVGDNAQAAIAAGAETSELNQLYQSQVGGVEQAVTQESQQLGMNRVRFQDNAAAAEQVTHATDVLDEKEAELRRRLDELTVPTPRGGRANPGSGESVTFNRATGTRANPGPAPGPDPAPSNSGSGKASEIDLLRRQLGQIEENREALLANNEVALSQTPDEWLAADEEAAVALSGIGNQKSALMQGVNNRVRQAEIAAVQDDDLTKAEALRNLSNMPVNPASQTPTEQVTDAATMSSQQQIRLDNSVGKAVKSIETTVTPLIESAPEGERPKLQQRWSRMQPEITTAISRSPQLMQWLERGDPTTQARANALLGMASHTALKSGDDVGTRIQGLVADRSSAAIDVGAKLANDPELNNYSAEERYAIAQIAMSLMDQPPSLRRGAYTPEQARREAIQRVEAERRE